MIAKPTVTVDMSSLKKFREGVASSSLAAPVLRALKQWAARYRGFVRERFETFSKGGGDWAQLAISTILARRHKKSTLKKIKKAGGVEAKIREIANVAILRDTGVLFAALSPTFGKPGQVEEVTEFGVRVGFGGSGQHPGGKATIADIAGFHQFGTPTMPARPILVPPDAATLEGMADDMARALDKLSKETGNS